MQKQLKQGYQTFKSIFIGMGITLRHLFQPSVTIQYPDVRDVLPAGARSKLYVNIDDCIGCNLCARACPVNCIDIETVKATADVDLGKTSTGNPKRLWVTQFDIDMSKCMYCDLCVHPCPTECIYMVQEYEYSDFNRDNLILKFSDLGPEKVAEVKEKLEKETEEKNREKELAQQKKEQEARAAKAEAEKPENAGGGNANTGSAGAEPTVPGTAESGKTGPEKSGNEPTRSGETDAEKPDTHKTDPGKPGGAAGK